MNNQYGSRRSVFLIPCIVVIILLVVPGIVSLLLSFNDYSPLMGLLNSNWVGFDNYEDLFSNYILPSLFFNSVRLSAIGGIIPVIIGVLIGRIVYQASFKFRHYIFGAMLLPTFVPSTVYSTAVIGILGSEMMMSQSGFDIAFFISTAVPQVFLSTFFTASFMAVCEHSNISEGRRAYISGAIMLFYAFATILSPNFETIYLLQNPLNVENSTVFDSQQIRYGLMESSFSIASTIWVVKTLFQLIVIVFSSLFLSKLLSKELTKYNIHIVSPENVSSAKIKTLFFTIVSIVITIGLCFYAIVFSGHGTTNQEIALPLSPAIFSSFLNALFVAMLFSVFTALCVYSLSIMPIQKGILFCSILVLFSGNIIGNYLQFYSIGLANSFLPIVLSEFIKPEMILYILILVIFTPKKERTSKEALSHILPYIVIFTGVVAANLWGGYIYDMIYVYDPSKFSLSLILSSLSSMGSGDATLMLLLTVVPITIAFISIIFYGKLMIKNERL